MVVFSTFTLSRSSMPGTFLISAAAPASATGFHSSPVLGWIFQFERSGAPMIFCNCGLTVVGTGMVLAGTSIGARTAVCATAFPVVTGAATRIDAEANTASLTRRMSEPPCNLVCPVEPNPHDLIQAAGEIRGRLLVQQRRRCPNP